METIVINGDGLGSYFPIYGSGVLLHKYIEFNHPEIIIVLENAKNMQGRCEMDGKVYSHNQMFIKLHNRLPHKRYSGEELYSLYKLSLSHDDHSYLIYRSIVEKMPVMYIPFIHYCEFAQSITDPMDMRIMHLFYILQYYSPQELNYKSYPRNVVQPSCLKRKSFRPAAKEIKEFWKIQANEKN